jgi:glycosyltransferase involved in cell wall biosynthesis
MEKVVNNEPLVSVIIPIYNTEECLDKCVGSIVNQTYKNLEIILVDDGSTDNSLMICDEWASKDNRIKVIHQENGGVSKARNTGLDNVTGEYISFVDSDDYVEKNYIDFLYYNLHAYGADISMGKQKVTYPNMSFSTASGNLYKYTPHDCFDMLMYHEDFDVSAWGKLFKKELFDGIRFPEGRLYEDTATTYKVMDRAKLIVLNSLVIYHYVIRENSITTSDFDESRMGLIQSTNEMCDYIEKKYPDLKQGCARRRMHGYLSTLSVLARSKNDNKKCRKEILTYIKEHAGEVLKDKRLPKRDRASLEMLSVSYETFKTAWTAYDRNRKKAKVK